MTAVFLASLAGLSSAGAEPDSDGDGLPDNWEIEAGLDPNNPADALLDLDGDGASNLLEYALGGDPRRSDTRVVPFWGLTADGQYFTLAIDRPLDNPGLNIEVQRAESLSAPVALGPSGLIRASAVEDPAHGREHVVYRTALPLSEAPSQFFRVAVRVEPVEPTVLLHTTLDDANAILAPAVGLAGATTLTAEGFVAGHEGNAARFRDATDLLSFPAVIGTQQNIKARWGEVEFWYRPNYNAAADDTLHVVFVAGDMYGVPRLAVTESDRLALTLVTPEWQTLSATAPYHAPLWNAGDWVRIRATWNRANPARSLQLFVNEALLGSAASMNPWELGPEAALGRLFIGAGNDLGHFTADGLIDDFVIREAPSRRGQAVLNQPPVLATIGNQAVAKANLLTFTASASDPNGDAFDFSLDTGAPVGARIDPASGVFQWTPSDAQASRTYLVTVRVTDHGTPALSAAETIRIAVTDPSVPGLTDPAVVVRPADLPLPPVGVAFVDPVFGTTLRRVSDSSERGGFETQEYNQLQAFSADDQYLLLTGSEGYLVRRVADLSRVDGLDTAGWNCARWLADRPHVLVHFDSNEDTTVRLQYTDVDARTTTTVFTFPPEYLRVYVNQSSDELSHDGRWLAGMLARADGANVIFALDLQTLTLGVQRPVAELYASDCTPDPIWGMAVPDWVGVSPLGRYLVVQWVRDGQARCNGLECFDPLTGDLRGRVTDSHAHGDLGLAADGATELFVTTSYFVPGANGFPTFITRELPGLSTVSPARPVLTTPAFSDEDHLSFQGPPGVVLVSWGRFGPAGVAAPFQDELFLVYLDGSVRRLTHHRSTKSDYWVQPRASMSRSGRYVVFASDWGRPTGGRGDPYLLDLTGVPVPRP